VATVRTFGLLNPQLCRLDGSASTPIGVERLVIAFDRTWAPHVQTQLQLVAPDPAAVAAIDPRTGFRARFQLQQDDLAGNAFSKPFDLAYRSRDVDWVAGAVAATAASDEALLQDWAQSGTGTGGYPDTSGGMDEATSRAGYVKGTRYFETADAPRVLINQRGNIPTAQDQDDYWAPGVSAFDYASQLAELAGVWLYGDETGVLRAALPGYAQDTTQRVFTESTNLINVVDSVSRDDASWGNYAVIGYTAPNSTTTEYVSSSAGIEPRKAIVLARARRKPVSGGNAATKVRTNAQRAGRRLQLTAIADLACRPNQPATATYRGQSFSGTLESVAFTFPEGTMQAVLAVTE
jgi:hypothetical protein